MHSAMAPLSSATSSLFSARVSCMANCDTMSFTAPPSHGSSADPMIGGACFSGGPPMGHPCQRWFNIEGGLSRGGVAFTCLSPIKKAKQPHTSFPPAPSARSFVRALVPACSYIPAPVPHPRVFGLPSAHNPRLRFFVHPQRSLRALAFSVRPRPRPAYGSFGSSQYSPFHHAPAPFRTLAISAPPSRLSFLLLRLPRAHFSALPLHIP